MSLVAVLSIGMLLMSVPVFADDTAKDNMERICAANPHSSVCKDWDSTQNPSPEKAVSDTVRNIINIMLFAIGIVAVISIIISGIRFVSSRGDSGAVGKARTSLIYSVIGLVVAVTAFAIVNFVIARLNEGNSGGGGGGGGGGGTQTSCSIPGQIQDPATGNCACPNGAPAVGNPLRCP
jgi:uncharacterized membrane protein YgcG